MSGKGQNELQISPHIQPGLHLKSAVMLSVVETVGKGKYTAPKAHTLLRHAQDDCPQQPVN